MIGGFICGNAGCIPESLGFVTGRACDWSIVIMIVRYLWCAMVKAAVILGSTSISWLWKSRAGRSCMLPMCLWLCLKLVVNSPFAEGDF